MAEIKIPEIEQVLKRQETMEKILGKILERLMTNEPSLTKDQLMTGPEILHYLHCGRSKLKELIEAGKIEQINDFGPRPRYRILKHDAA